MKTRLLLVAALLIAVASQVAPAAGPVTAVTVENLTGAVRPAGPATFGVFFARGDVAGSVAIDGLATQADVKRRWPDGSVKHAILTVSLPEMPAGAGKPLALVAVEAAQAAPQPQSLPAPALPAELPDLSVTFRIHNGPTEVARLRGALPATGETKVWLAGPQANEWILRAAPIDAATGKADPDLEVRFHVRHYPAVGVFRVAVVVENCKWTSPGSVPYDVTISEGEKELFAQKDAGRWPKDDKPRGQTMWTRWVKRFWFGRALDDVNVRYDKAYIFRSGLLPRYDPAVELAPKAIDDAAKRWARAETDPLQRGTITAYFGTTGGREEIAPLPAWTARYLFSQDPRALAYMLGNADLAGGCPVHIRDPKTDWIISIDEHPTYSLNDRGTRERRVPRDASETPYVLDTRNGFTLDAAHQASFNYVPYLVTGDYYYLEGMEFWAAYNFIVIHEAYRKRDTGLLTPNQVRGVAWTLRNLTHAAALAPDGSKAKAYFEAKLANNLTYLKDWVNGPEASPLGTFKMGAGHAYTRGWPGGKNWETDWRSRYFSIPPWQHNFLAWAAAYVTGHGYADAAAFRDYLAKWTIGIATHPDQITPHAGCSYFVFVGERRKDKSIWWYDTWKDMHERTYSAPGSQPRKMPLASRGEYHHAARGVIIEAMRAALPAAREAFEWIDAQDPKLDATFTAHPTWAFEVPGK